MSAGQKQTETSRSGMIMVVIPDATFALLGEIAERIETATEGIDDVRVEVKHVRSTNKVTASPAGNTGALPPGRPAGGPESAD